MDIEKAKTTLLNVRDSFNNANRPIEFEDFAQTDEGQELLSTTEHRCLSYALCQLLIEKNVLTEDEIDERLKSVYQELVEPLKKEFREHMSQARLNSDLRDMLDRPVYRRLVEFVGEQWCTENDIPQPKSRDESSE